MALSERRLENMLSAVKGYYDGSKIVMNEDIPMMAGQEVIITILEPVKTKTKNYDLRKYMGRGEKMFPDSDAADYVRSLRENDRI